MVTLRTRPGTPVKKTISKVKPESKSQLSKISEPESPKKAPTSTITTISNDVSSTATEDLQKLVALASSKALASLQTKPEKSKSEDVMLLQTKSSFESVFPTSLQSYSEKELYLNYKDEKTATKFKIEPHQLAQSSGDPEGKLKLKKRKATDEWKQMKTQEMTPEIERDLKILKLRNVFDRNRHYKQNDSDRLPKEFQIGTVIASPHEFYSSRLVKKDRAPTLVGEIMKDEKNRAYYKKKFKEVQEASLRTRKFHGKERNKRHKNKK